MVVINANEFFSNQESFLEKAKKGISVFLKSKHGTFKIEPLSQEEELAKRISDGLNEIKLIREGKLSKLSMQSLLDEL